MELFSPVSEALNHTESFSYMFSEEEPTSGFRQWMESLNADITDSLNVKTAGSESWKITGWRDLWK